MLWKSLPQTLSITCLKRSQSRVSCIPDHLSQTLQSRVSTLDRFRNCRRRFCKDTPPILGSNCKLIRAAREPVIYLLGGGVEALGEITWFSRGTEGDQLSPSENKGGGDCRKLSASEGA